MVTSASENATEGTDDFEITRPTALQNAAPGILRNSSTVNASTNANLAAGTHIHVHMQNPTNVNDNGSNNLGNNLNSKSVRINDQK